MKGWDWFIVLFLIIAGLTCLTMSATGLMDNVSIHSYFKNFLQICIWIGIPIVSAGIVYYIIKGKRGTHK